MTLLPAGAAILIATTTVGLPVTWLTTAVALVRVLVLSFATAFLHFCYSITLLTIPVDLQILVALPAR